MSAEQGNPGEVGPLADAAFERNWEAARQGLAVESSAPADPAPDATTSAAAEPDAAPAPATPETTPPAPGQGQAQASDWTPPDRDTWQKTQEAARHWNSFQGNWPKIEERWKQEQLTPLQQQLQEREAELTRLRDEKRLVTEGYLRSLPPEQREAKRVQLEQYDREMAAEIEQNRQRQQHEAELARREQAIQQSEQRIMEQETHNLRQTVRSTIDPYATTLSDQFGVPKDEIKQYIDSLNISDFIDQAPVHELRTVGPMMKAVEQYAQMRGTQIAADNARRQSERGTYRAEGTGTGAGGLKVSHNDMPDKEFEALWDRIKGNEPR